MTIIQLTPEEEAEITRRFENFDPTTATMYLGDDLLPHIVLIRARATTDYRRSLAKTSTTDARSIANSDETY